MDKRYKPLSPIEQMQKRQFVIDMIARNPDWPIYKVARFIRTELHLTLTDMSKITKIAPQTLQKMEQPNSNPTLDSILKLLSPFGLKLRVSS
jgi:DNA-binding XRE family transcriptional regulator